MGTLPATFGMLPSNPPPPNITTLAFQSVGSATLNRMSGAVVSIGEILPLTRQCSGMALAPVPAAGTIAADATTAPRVGRPISLAGTVRPTSLSHVFGLSACPRLPASAACASVSAEDVADLSSPPPPPQPASAAANKTAVAA